MALNNAEDILAEPLGNYGEDNPFADKLRAKTSVIKTVLGTQAKVDETRLRRQQFDRMPQLLKMVEEAAKKLPNAVRQGPVIDYVPAE